MSLIGKLPAFNLLTNTINISSKESVNNTITYFTNVRSVADPLFSKRVCQKENTYFNDASYVSLAQWFERSFSERSVFTKFT